jgi:hypothetical protein
MAVVAERAFTSRSTLQRVEAGDANVSIGIYAGVLQALGMLGGLGNLADIGNDPTGQVLARAALPKRVHLAPPPQGRGMADFEVHLDLDGEVLPVGLARSNRVRGGETILFEYDDRWLARLDRFSLEPALRLTRGVFAPPAGLATFGSIGDSARGKGGSAVATL